jgi:hypothetical protein
LQMSVLQAESGNEWLRIEAVDQFRLLPKGGTGNRFLIAGILSNYLVIQLLWTRQFAGLLALSAFRKHSDYVRQRLPRGLSCFAHSHSARYWLSR